MIFTVETNVLQRLQSFQWEDLETWIIRQWPIPKFAGIIRQWQILKFQFDFCPKRWGLSYFPPPPSHQDYIFEVFVGKRAEDGCQKLWSRLCHEVWYPPHLHQVCHLHLFSPCFALSPEIDILIPLYWRLGSMFQVSLYEMDDMIWLLLLKYVHESFASLYFQIGCHHPLTSQWHRLSTFSCNTYFD